MTQTDKIEQDTNDPNLNWHNRVFIKLLNYNNIKAGTASAITKSE